MNIPGRHLAIVAPIATAIFLILVTSCSSMSIQYSKINPSEEPRFPTAETPTSEAIFETDRISIYRILEFSSKLSQFSLDDRYLATTPDNNLISVLKFPSLERVVDLIIPRSGLNGSNAIAFSQDNSLIAVGGLENRVDLLNMGTGSLIDSLNTDEVFPQPVSVSDLFFLPGEQKVIIASNKDNGGIALWSYSSHDSSRYFSKPVNSISDHACEDRIVASSWPTGIRLETDNPIILLNLETYQFTDIQLNGVVGSDVQFFSSCSKIAAIIDGVVYIIDIRDSTFTDLRDLIGDAVAVRMDVSQGGLLAILTSEAYSFPSDTIFGPYVEADARYVLSLVNLEANEIIDHIPLVGVTDIDLTADGAYLVVASHSRPVTIWRIH